MEKRSYLIIIFDFTELIISASLGLAFVAMKKRTMEIELQQMTLRRPPKLSALLLSNACCKNKTNKLRSYESWL